MNKELVYEEINSMNNYINITGFLEIREICIKVIEWISQINKNE